MCTDRRLSARVSSDHPAIVAQQNPCSTSRSCVQGLALRQTLSLGSLPASLCSHDQIPLRYTGGRYAWRSLPSLHASAAPSIVGSHNALGCRPVHEASHAVPPADRGDAHSAKSSDRPESASQHVAGSSGGPAAPTRQARDAPEALQLFCDNLLQDVPVQTQVRDQALQLAVLLAQLAQFP